MFVHMYLYIYCILFLFLISRLCIEISIQPSLRAPFCLIQSVLSLCVPYPLLCSTRLCPCFGPFPHSANLLLVCISVNSLNCHQPMRSFRDFRDFSRFYEILNIFKFYFLSSRVKNHICILWYQNMCFSNNNNNNNNNNRIH